MSVIGNLAPVPLPGECVYSIVAAFTRRWFRGKRHGAVLLLDGAAPCARDVPARLPQLACNLPSMLKLDARQLALQHTALPIHLPFLDDERRTQLTQDAFAGGSMQLKLGIAPSQIVSARALRLCPRCVRQDQATYGRAYWHREHQLAGALVCPWHRIPLSTTLVRPEWSPGHSVFACPAEARIQGEERLTAKERKIAIRVSGTLAALLEGMAPCPGPSRLHAYYRQQLIAKGYNRPNRSIAVGHLRADLIRYYGSRLLRRIGCHIPANYGWLATLIRKPRNHVQPLRHVLLITFLGTSTEVFAEAMKAEPSPALAREHPNRIKNTSLLNKLRPSKRRAWLRALAANRGFSARQCEGALYGWLWRNDREWLANHRNPRPRRTPDLAKWTQRDQRLAARIPGVARDIRRQRPWRRACRSAIASHCGAASWLVQDHPYLPKAVAAIKAARESAADFAIRRLKELANDPGLFAAPIWKLRVKAGISVTVAKQASVACALQEITHRRRSAHARP